MLSKSLLKKTIKDNWKFWAIITGVLCLFLIMMIAVSVSFAERMADRPGTNADFNILEQYFSMFAILLPMIYIVLTANKLLAAQIDRGSLAYVMANPIKRNQVSITQAVYFIGSIIAMFTLIAITGTATIAIMGSSIEIGSFLLLCLGAVLLLLAISGISYLASCIFNLSRKSLAFGAGIPIAFFLFSTLANFSNLAEIMGYFKYITINTLFNITDVINYSTNMIWQFLILFAIAAVCYTCGVVFFKKKDLPL